MLRIRPISEPNRLCRVISLCLSLAVSLSLFSLDAFACTYVYTGEKTTENGSVYMGRCEDFGPDYAKQFVIVPAKDHEPGEMMEDDDQFSAPYPAHTLRYSVIMDDPSTCSEKTAYPFAEAGMNEKGVSVSATVSTFYNDKVLKTDPAVTGGLSELSMASYILQSAESAEDGVRILADRIDTYGHGKAFGSETSMEVSTVLIADSKETWVMEIVSGHEYIATRLSEDTVSLNPNTILTQQVNVRDQNVIASPGLISTAKKGGFYYSDMEGDDEINVMKSYSEGFPGSAGTRYYYGAYILNRDLAETLDIVSKDSSELKALYPNASVQDGTIGPYPLEYQPSEEMKGKISLMTLREVFSSHGENTPYETTSNNVNAEGVKMRSIGTYKQNEEHIFETRRNRDLPDSICTIEWLALGPAEFSVLVPFYTAAMRKTPDSYTTSSPDVFEPESVYWLFNEIGNIGNGKYYRKDQNDVYHDRYGNEIDAETAEAVLLYLKDSGLTDRLHERMRQAQEEMNVKAAADDEKIIALAKNGPDEEVENMADQLAEENAAIVKKLASETLAEIDAEVSAFLQDAGTGKTETTQTDRPPIEEEVKTDMPQPAETKANVPLSAGLFLLLCGGVICFVLIRGKNSPEK